MTGGCDRGGLGGAIGGIASGIGGLIQSQPTASGDLASASGYTDAASAYSTGSTMAATNSQIALNAANVQQLQVARNVAKTVGSQQAEEAGAGFGNSGTSLYLLRDSMQQGALARGVIGIQGAINANSYNMQSTSLAGESQQAAAAASAAQSAAKGASSSGIFGAIGSIAGAMLPFLL